jgi:UDP-N-acetylmuramate dehydrogenase
MLVVTDRMAPPDPPELLELAPLAGLTSVGVGGPARFFARVARAEMLPELLDWAARRSLPVTLLGGGSNVVFADAGVEGLVLSVALRGVSATPIGADEVELAVGAGEEWDPFVASCVARGFAGLECLSGIPGQVGATPIQNVGAYGQDVSGVLASVDVHDAVTHERRRLGREECGFGYRTSRFKAADGARFIVLGASFRLRVGGDACVSYPEIARQLAAPGTPAPGLARVREVVLETRRAKSMVLDASDENRRSCGSFFLNPELSAQAFDALAARTRAVPPGYRQPDGRVKVPAAWLIEQAGFRRGQRFGAAGISSRHALALVCHEGATAASLVEAAHRVRDGVARAFDVVLAPEPRFYGFGTPSEQLPPLAGQ